MPSYKQSLGLALLVGELVSFATAGFPYCLPGNTCYPSASAWADFNATVGGRLIQTIPYGTPCYAATYNAGECLALIKKKGDLSFRDSLPGMIYTMTTAVINH